MKKFMKEKNYIHILFITIVIFAVGLSAIVERPVAKIASLFLGYDVEANSNIFGIGNEIENYDEYMEILEDVSYIFNMQGGEASVITNDNEVFFIKEILDNNSVYIVIVKNDEGAAIMTLSSLENQNDLLKEQIRKQIEILKGNAEDK
jgi:hypothetical protein